MPHKTVPRQSVAPDVVSLKVPGQAEYIAILRLAVSGLANRLDLSFDDSEDLKLAITEACGHILRQSTRRITLRLDCRILPDELEIEVCSEPHSNKSARPTQEQPEHNDLGVSLIEALMDRMSIQSDPKQGTMAVTMARRLTPSDNRENQ